MWLRVGSALSVRGANQHRPGSTAETWARKTAPWFPHSPAGGATWEQGLWPISHGWANHRPDHPFSLPGTRHVRNGSRNDEKWKRGLHSRMVISIRSAVRPDNNCLDGMMPIGLYVRSQGRIREYAAVLVLRSEVTNTSARPSFHTSQVQVSTADYCTESPFLLDWA